MSQDTIDKKLQNLDDKILVFYNLEKLDQGKAFASRKLNIESSYINGADEEEISKQLDSLERDIDTSMFSIIQGLEEKIMFLVFMMSSFGQNVLIVKFISKQ